MTGPDKQLLKRSGLACVEDVQLKVRDVKTRKMRMITLAIETVALGQEYPLILGLDWLKTNVDKIVINSPEVEIKPGMEIEEVTDHEGWGNSVENA